jgi:glycosyltransferase involved in cell wall biosynthesis
MKPIAIVTPWFGLDLKGGAEQQAWQIATRLAARGHAVEVLTTCCRSFFDDWSKNHLSEGEKSEAGLKIRRFLVNRRDRQAFSTLNCDLLSLPQTALHPGVSPVSLKQAAIWTQHNINSSRLEKYLESHSDKYHAFIFLPYLYGVILRGLPLVAEQAWLQPCLHDEVYAYLPDIGHVFRAAKGFLFISAGEQQLAARLYGPLAWAKGIVAGAGIEEWEKTDNCSAISELPIDSGPYVLCLGRRYSGKGTDRLCSAFRIYRSHTPSSPLRLVLAGPGSQYYGDDMAGIIDLGLVSDPVKTALIQNCLALLQPSTNESFSRVLFESWAHGKPVVVHQDCLATAFAVKHSGGGWLAGEEHEWVMRIAEIERMNAHDLRLVGEKGLNYARELSDWDRVMRRYEHALGIAQEISMNVTPQKTKHPRRLNAIHQLLPHLAYGDAISGEAICIRNWLREMGYRSEIFVRASDARVANQCQSCGPKSLKPEVGLIYHHSIGSDITSIAVAHPGPKCMIYHNITPAGFFEPYRPEFAQQMLRDGREQMWTLAHAFHYSVGDSNYNAEELSLYGFRNPGVLPLAVDPGKWRDPPDEDLMAQLQDGKRNILFVGRYAPNKCQHELVEGFRHYLTLDADARLILVGSEDIFDPYIQHIHQTVIDCAVADRVMLPGHITDSQLQAYYRCANLFWSMSEHEGFCVPLIEAMWFDVPILAYRSSAVSETLAQSGILFVDKSDPAVLAKLAYKLLDDAVCRDEVLKQQHERRKEFAPQTVREQFMQIIDSLYEQTGH